MKKILILLLVAVAGMANAQDLLNDFVRNSSTSYDSADAAYLLQSTGATAYRTGVVDTPLGVLRGFLPTSPTGQTAKGYTSVTNDNIFASNSASFSSGIWWNLSTSPYTLGNAVTLPASSVVLVSWDVIPAVQLETLSAGTHVVTYEITALSGTSTPGTLQFWVFTNGAWVKLANANMTIPSVSATFTLNYSAPVKLRWVLVRNGGAMASVDLETRVN
ncbi:MAG TPA: hypothetical protein VGL56_03715 [Fimbriimonadaceae bacterium]|jgi:hypothetical protein